MSLHAGWRADDAMYFSFEVPDNKMIGTRTEPLGQPWLDDSVAVYLNFSNVDDKDVPDEKTIRVVISAAGGATVQRGGSGGWQDDTTWFGLSKQGTIRYGVKRYGEINNPAKKSEKYTVELALKWDLLGLTPPPPGRNVEIGFAASCHSASGNNTTDYWPVNLNNENILNPSLWGRMTILANNKLIEAEKDKIFIPIMNTRPFIDGIPDGAEWLYSGVINLPLTPEAVTTAPIKTTVMPIIASWFLTGEEKIGICRPVISVGKFITPDSAVFYQRHFATMTQYGIDAIIITPEDLTPSFINAIASAPLLKIPVPSIAIGIPASKLMDAAIAELAVAKLQTIPALYRLTTTFSNKLCCPVFIKDRNYVLLLSEGKIVGKLTSANVSPSVIDGTNEVITRRSGDEFREQLEKSRAMSPSFIAINSYNDYIAGIAIAPTAQYGNTDLSTLFTTITSWRANQKQVLNLTGTDIPAFLQRGTELKTKFRIKNSSSESLATTDGIRIEYNILKKKQTVANGIASGNIFLPANSYGEVTVNLSTFDKKHHPLVNGDYTLEIVVYSSPTSEMKIPMFTKKIAEYSLPIQIKSTAPPVEKIVINNENACKFLAIELSDQINDPTAGVFTIANLSSKKWDKNQVSIKCYMTTVDGREIPGATGSTKIENECPDGTIIQQQVTLTPPALSGLINCYFSIEIDGKPANIFGALLPVIRINTGKRWQFIDISKTFNASCSYSDNNNLFNRADIDGKGNAFPTEDFLPDALGINNAYPVGYQTERIPKEDDPWYRFPSAEKGRYPAILAKSQKIPINRSGQAICMAVFSTDDKQNAEFIIEYKDGTTSKAAVSIPYWLDEPGDNDVPIFRTNHIKTSHGNNRYFNGTVYSLIIPTDKDKEITSITLPENDKIYLTSITIDTGKLAGNDITKP